MRMTRRTPVALHWRSDGDPDGKPVVFANSLGTDLRLWDDVLPRLPADLRIIRFDLRGHGLSDCPDGPYSLDELVADTAALLDEVDCGPAVFVGLSIGGMIGQALASRRPDLVRALVLSNSAARMGDKATWQARMKAIEADDLEAIADAVLDRWFGTAFRTSPKTQAWKNMLTRTPRKGYLGCCAALAQADLTKETRSLRLPTLAIAGTEDKASPEALVAATAALIPGCDFQSIAGAGHLPCVEDPARFADILNPFLVAQAYSAASTGTLGDETA